MIVSPAMEATIVNTDAALFNPSRKLSDQYVYGKKGHALGFRFSMDQNVAATGGPNLPSIEAGFVERAVARSPGSPAEVLIAADRAEHVPGCNMAFNTEALKAIGGFDAAYTAAGDDVDVCWKLLDGGAQIAFSPAAQIRHHRRSTVKGYLKQQRGYGRAERMPHSTRPSGWSGPRPPLRSPLAWRVSHKPKVRP